MNYSIGKLWVSEVKECLEDEPLGDVSEAFTGNIKDESSWGQR